jgi:hypothetical protein
MAWSGEYMTSLTSKGTLLVCEAPIQRLFGEVVEPHEVAVRGSLAIVSAKCAATSGLTKAASE